MGGTWGECQAWGHMGSTRRLEHTGNKEGGTGGEQGGLYGEPKEHTRETYGGRAHLGNKGVKRAPFGDHKE